MLRPLRIQGPGTVVAALVAVATAGLALLQQSAPVIGHARRAGASTWSMRSPGLDGKTLVTGGSMNTVRLWDAATRKEIKRFDGHGGLVLAVALSPDGSCILSASLDKTAKLWQFAARARS